MEEMISRNDAYKTLTEYYHHTTEIQHKALREALERVPDSQPELIEREAYIRGFEQGKTQGRLDTLSARPERLTDDDFETIRIHMNAYKEKLCNQHRWEEADEYQRIIDRFMAFASAQPETHDKRTETHGVCLDAIDRQAAIDALTRKMVSIPTAGEKDLMGDVNRIRAEDISVIRRLPSAQPEQTNSCYTNSWCIDCKEYDKEKHSCPRFNRVIKQTLDEIYSQAEIVRCKDCIFHGLCRTSPKWAVAPKDDWYCADAERRTDEQTV